MTRHRRQELNGNRVAILVMHGFEQVEMMEPRKALDEAGARTEPKESAGTSQRRR